jgi:ABC-type sugar transport system ATPase subunit
MSVKSIEREINELSGRYSLLQKQDIEKGILIKEKKEFIENASQARHILTEAASQIQEEVKEKIETLITLALNSIFTEKKYKFELIFEYKRNKLECRPILYENDKERQITSGALIDTISFTWRVILHSIQHSKTRNIFFLDEPFKYLGKSMMSKAGAFIKEVSRKLNIQFIIVSHEPQFSEIADRTFFVSNDNGTSNVTHHGEVRRKHKHGKKDKSRKIIHSLDPGRRRIPKRQLSNDDK